MGCAKARDYGRVGIGGNITQAREVRGLSLDGLAERLGFSIAGVVALEKNEREPTPREWEALLFALRFPKQFYFRPDQPPGQFEPLMCGESIVQCARCIYVAEFLCDFPMGGGKTCDAPLCDKHAIGQGAEWEDLHFCPQHSLIDRGAVVSAQGLGGE